MIDGDLWWLVRYIEASRALRQENLDPFSRKFWRTIMGGLMRHAAEQVRDHDGETA